MPTLKLGHISPTPEEEAEILAAALSDPGCPPLTEEDFAAARPFMQFGAHYLGAGRIGRPPVTIKRPSLNMRVDPDVLQHLRAGGKGWQTRVNALLREAMEQGRI